MLTATTSTEDYLAALLWLWLCRRTIAAEKEFYNKRRSHNTIHATGKARATASSEAVVLTVAVVGPPIRGIVESASTVVLAEKTIPIPLPLIPTPPHPRAYPADGRWGGKPRPTHHCAAVVRGPR